MLPSVMIRPLLSKRPTFCNLTSYHFFLFCHVAVCFLPPLSGIFQFLCDVGIFYLIHPHTNLAISASLAWCDTYWLSSQLKATGSTGKKKPFFLVLNTVLLPQDLVHTESFVEDKFCATISIQNRAMVSTCSTSHTGTVKRRCSALLRGPAKVLWYRWCISICELVLLCKYAEVRISYFSCKMEEVAADWRNFFQVSCKWNTKVENQNLFSKCMKKY